MSKTMASVDARSAATRPTTLALSFQKSAHMQGRAL
jgi:hypothetical protein